MAGWTGVDREERGSETGGSWYTVDRFTVCGVSWYRVTFQTPVPPGRTGSTGVLGGPRRPGPRPRGLDRSLAPSPTPTRSGPPGLSWGTGDGTSSPCPGSAGRPSWTSIHTRGPPHRVHPDVPSTDVGEWRTGWRLTLRRLSPVPRPLPPLGGTPSLRLDGPPRDGRRRIGPEVQTSRPWSGRGRWGGGVVVRTDD